MSTDNNIKKHSPTQDELYKEDRNGLNNVSFKLASFFFCILLIFYITSK